MGDEEERVEINIEINNELDKKIVDQFSLFDELDVKKIEPETVGVFLRSLGLYVTNADVEDIKKRSISPQVPNAFHIGLMLPHITECFAKRKYIPKTIEEVFDAFHILDPDKKSTLEVAYAQDVFKNNGDAFDETELAEFMVRAVDHRIHKINYEYVINSLCRKLNDEDDLFKLADSIDWTPKSPN